VGVHCPQRLVRTNTFSVSFEGPNRSGTKELMLRDALTQLPLSFTLFSGCWVPHTGSQDAGPSGCVDSAEDLNLLTRAPTAIHQYESTVAKPLRGVKRTMRLLLSKLHEALCLPARLLQRNALSSMHGRRPSLDDLEILNTIGT
jgi:hypothetical protein